MPAKQEVVRDVACEVLGRYAASKRASSGPEFHDAGPAVLAALTMSTDRDVVQEVCFAALLKWLEGCRQGTPITGIIGGLAGFLAGMQVACSFSPLLVPLTRQIRESLAATIRRSPWRKTAVGWEDYDLISGPAGIILAMATDRDCPAHLMLPAARHLACLCDDDGLERLRIGLYRDEKQRAWNFGRINTGLAHGVSAVAAALSLASVMTNDLKGEISPPLRRLCQWLVAESYVDERGLRTWHPAGRDGASPPRSVNPRQAWCYGSPGIIWTLWQASKVLGDSTLQAFAENAIRTFCASFNETIYLDGDPVEDSLGICHGAAGTLAIIDAFERHAALTDIVSVGQRLEKYLLDRINEIRRISQEDMTLLTGGSGTLAVLLTRYGAQREWLVQIALH